MASLVLPWFEQAHRTVFGVRKSCFFIWAFSYLGKRCPRQYNDLYIFPVKSLMHSPSQLLEKWVPVPPPASRLVVRAPIIPLGGQTVRAQAPSHSYREGLMGTSCPLGGTQRLRTATSHLPPFQMVTRQSLLPHGKLPPSPLQNHHLRLSNCRAPCMAHKP